MAWMGQWPRLVIRRIASRLCTLVGSSKKYMPAIGLRIPRKPKLTISEVPTIGAMGWSYVVPSAYRRQHGSWYSLLRLGLQEIFWKVSSSNLFFICYKFSRLTFCLHLMEPNWPQSSICFTLPCVTCHVNWCLDRLLRFGCSCYRI